MEKLEKYGNIVLNTWNKYINPEILTPYGYYAVITIFILLVLFQNKNIWRYFFYRYQSATNKLVHIKISVPKNDSKTDNEKRTEKDFKEQLSKAEQLLRSLHETRGMNLHNIIFRRMLWKEPRFSFELQIEKQILSFVIVCDKYYQKIIEKQVTSFYESADIEILKKEQHFDLKPKGYHTNGFYLYTEKQYFYPIQTFDLMEEDPLNNITNAFSKLREDEKGVLQMILFPTNNRWQKKARETGTLLFKEKKINTFSIWHVPFFGPILGIIFLPFKIIFWPFRFLFHGYDPSKDPKNEDVGFVRMLQSEEEIAKQIGEKSNRAGYETIIRVFASSKEKERVQETLDGIFVSMNTFQGKGTNRFENRRIIPLNMINAPIIIHNFKHRLPCFLEKQSLLATNEIATIYHFPDAKYNKMPIIKWMEYKVLPPPINLPNEGIILGNSIYRGVTKPVHVLREDRTRHMYTLGKSGSGKSVLLWNMAIQDIQNGEGVCVIDPHGDLIDDIAACIPKERAKDIIIFNPGDEERPMGLNLLETKNSGEFDRASLDAMEIFIKLFGNEIFGPRIQHYFRNGCLTLMEDQEEGATLIDIPRLFIDDEFQKSRVTKVKNPVVKAFWENEMAQTGDREKQEMIPYFTSKFGPFVTNTIMRNIIGQTKSAFNIREIMDSQKVLLINLSKGIIGGINAQLLGMIIVAKINMAAMGRADIPKEQRKDFYLYVDEFQNFATDTFASILSEARKYRLNLIMAHQYIAQLSEGTGGIAIGQKESKLRDAVFGNVGSMITFKVGADDAEYLEKEYAPDLSQQDILGIANFKAYIKLNINNTTSKPFSMQTLYDPTLKNEKVLNIVKKYSSMKYGRKKEFVDAEIEARLGVHNIKAITNSAIADPTVHNDLLTPDPNTGNNYHEIQNNIDKSTIPEYAKTMPDTTQMTTLNSEPMQEEKTSTENTTENNTSQENERTNNSPEIISTTKEEEPANNEIISNTAETPINNQISTPQPNQINDTITQKNEPPTQI